MSLNTGLKQVGERESMTRRSKKPPVQPEAFLVPFGKARRSHREWNGICSIIADSDLCLMKSNSIFPIWHCTERILAHVPQVPFFSMVPSELGGLNQCPLLMQAMRYFSSKAQPLPEEAEHPCSARLQQQSGCLLFLGLTLRSNFCSLLKNTVTSIHS